MCFLKFGVAVMVICALTACSATLPKSQLVSYDRTLGQQGGVVLLVDVCIQRDVLGTDDYFVIAESKSGAHAVLGALKKYVQDSNIPIRTALIPFVCGARLDTHNSSIRVADSVDSPVHDAQKPLGVSEMIKDDPPYVNALSVLSSYAFENAAVSGNATGTKNSSNFPTTVGAYDTTRNGNEEDVFVTNDGNMPRREAPKGVDIEDFRTAVNMIKNRTQASSLLFLGVIGTSRSTGKAVAQGIGAFTVGMATGVVTGGLGTGYYLAFVPGYQIDGRVMEGPLIDFESGQLTWANAVRAGGDPIKPGVIENPQALDLLFRDIMFKPVSAQ